MEQEMNVAKVPEHHCLECDELVPCPEGTELFTANDMQVTICERCRLEIAQAETRKTRKPSA